MKTLLILILLVIAGGGAYLSKPSEQSFKDMITRTHASKEKADLVQFIQNGFRDDSQKFLDSCTFKNRIFWTTVQCNGKTVYTGAFGTWFGSDLSIQKATN